MYRQIYHRYRWYILFTVPMSVLLGAASVGVIAVISDAIGSAGGERDFSAVAFLAVIVALFVVGLANDLLRARLYSGVIHDIQIHMIRRVMNTPLARLERVGLHRVVATLTEDMEKAIKYFHVLPLLFVNIAICCCGVLYMAYLSPPLLLIVLTMVAFGGATLGALILSTKRDRAGIRELTDELTHSYQQLVFGAKELMLSSHRSEHFRGAVFGVVSGMRALARRVLSVLALVEQWGQLVLFGIIGGVIFVVGQYVPVSNEVILGYVITLLFLLDPIETVITCVDEMVEAKVAFEKIESLGLAEADSRPGSHPGLPPPGVSELVARGAPRARLLEAREVEFSYADDDGEKRATFALGPVSATFRSGEVTLIVGGNGSGKSTLLKIICGLYPLSAGEVLLDGRPVVRGSAEGSAKNLFSMVSPDFCLFRDVLDSRGQPCSDDMIEQVLTRLELDEVVSFEKGRLGSLDYSQGQKKRLALLQVYLEDRPIVLLDEWAADQDALFKDVFYSEILPDLKQRGKIVVVVSHDERYFDRADRVLKIDEGRLIADRAEVA